MQTEIQPITACSKCGIAVHPETHEFNKGLCDSHYSMKRLAEDRSEKYRVDSKKMINERIAIFNEKCPKKYQENDTSKIKVESFDRVINWSKNPQGLICMGESQRGKTTTCWKLIEKLYVMHGIGFEAMTEPEFSGNAAKHYRDKTIDSWLQHLFYVPILFIDDIGHSASTSRHLEDLYLVVEKRTSWKRPIIATTQFSDQELSVKAKNYGGEKTIQAILNRLKASCSIVIF